MATGTNRTVASDDDDDEEADDDLAAHAGLLGRSKLVVGKSQRFPHSGTLVTTPTVPPQHFLPPSLFAFLFSILMSQEHATHTKRHVNIL